MAEAEVKADCYQSDGAIQILMNVKKCNDGDGAATKGAHIPILDVPRPCRTMILELLVLAMA